MDAGMRLFAGRRPLWLLGAIGGFVYIGAIIAFTFFFPSTPARVTLFSVMVISICVDIVSDCLRSRREISGAMPYLVALVFSTLALFFFIRIVFTFLHPYTSVLAPNGINRLLFLIQDIAVVSWSLCFILLRNAQLFEAVASGEKLYRGIFENAGVGIFQSSEDGRLLRANAAFTYLFGYLTEEEYFGEKGSETAWLYSSPDERLKLLAELEREGSFAGREIQTVKRDGSTLWLSVNASLVRLGNGSKVITGTIVDISDRVAEGLELKRARDEKTILLSELKHRVKNGMSVIASLVNLESGRAAATETKETLSSLGDKVLALSALYDLLYRAPESRKIRLDSYLQSIIDALCSSYGTKERGIDFIAHLDEVEIDFKSAEALGLIAVELITDSLKHAFPKGRKGRIELSLGREGPGEIALVVRDDGIGLPPGFSPAESSGFGMMIVRMLADQLQGRLETSNDKGALFRLCFPAPDQEK